MQEPNFTPGPWCLDGFCLTTVLKKVRDKSDPEAKHLCGDFDEIGRFKKIEDARLAHAAPELYEALEAENALIVSAQELIASYLPPDGISKDALINGLIELFDGPRQRAAQSQSNAALAKALGEA
jgi:hypothetical protein